MPGAMGISGSEERHTEVREREGMNLLIFHNQTIVFPFPFLFFFPTCTENFFFFFFSFSFFHFLFYCEILLLLNLFHNYACSACKRPDSMLDFGNKAVDITDIILPLKELPALLGTHENTDHALWDDDCWVKGTAG